MNSVLFLETESGYTVGQEARPWEHMSYTSIITLFHLQSSSYLTNLYSLCNWSPLNEVNPLCFPSESQISRNCLVVSKSALSWVTHSYKCQATMPPTPGYHGEMSEIGLWWPRWPTQVFKNRAGDIWKGKKNMAFCKKEVGM